MPDAFEAEASEMVKHRLSWREIAGQIAPGAPGAQNVEDGVENAAQRVRALLASSRQWREQTLGARPFGVREIARRRGTHAPERTSLHQLGAI